jgi:hypothetical protein
MKAILLTKEQADKVRGRHGTYSKLDPMVIADGRFILPIEVLTDPEHKEVFNSLGECKYAEIDIVQKVDAKLPELDPMKETQVFSVKSVSKVIIAAEVLREVI